MNPKLEKERKCRDCGGDGWYAEHTEFCHIHIGKECNCTGEQEQCHACSGTGKVAL